MHKNLKHVQKQKFSKNIKKITKKSVYPMTKKFHVCVLPLFSRSFFFCVKNNKNKKPCKNRPPWSTTRSLMGWFPEIYVKRCLRKNFDLLKHFFSHSTNLLVVVIDVYLFLIMPTILQSRTISILNFSFSFLKNLDF